MNTFPADLKRLTPQDVCFGDDNLIVRLADGRVLAAPLAWFPRLFQATPAERNHWRWIGRGIGIHWPDVDDDIAIMKRSHGSMNSQRDAL